MPKPSVEGTILGWFKGVQRETKRTPAIGGTHLPSLRFVVMSLPTSGLGAPAGCGVPGGGREGTCVASTCQARDAQVLVGVAFG